MGFRWLNFGNSTEVYQETAFKYNEHGQIRESIEYSLSDSSYYIINYEYISKESKQPFKEIFNFENTRNIRYYEYDIDQLGNLLTIKGYNHHDELIYSKEYSYHYDKVGNWIKKIHSEFGIPKFIVEREIHY